MSDLGGLTEAPVATVPGWFGKHPGHGDFVARGVDDDLRDAIRPHLDAALTDLRDRLGVGWQEVFDAVAPVRFWLGAAVTGLAPVMGVLIPSRDRVGRRYPLVALSWADATPPSLGPDQTAHDALETAAFALRDGDADSPTAGLGGGAAQAGDDLLWATNLEGVLPDLLSDIAAEDLRRAARLRSYWWTARGTGHVVALTGWPDGAVLGWLMGLDGGDHHGQ